tara:strand:- start:24881 stop:25954 length:1074 start_codon:yes stop_codon:yes gene_type:complete
MDAKEQDDTAHQESDKPGRKKGFLMIGLVVLVLAAAGGVAWWLHARNYESTDDAFIDAQVVRIAPQIAGIVSELPVQPNDHVAAGTLLATIAPDNVMPVVARQKAGVSEARAQAASTRANAQSAQAALHRANADVSEAQARYNNARSNLARLTAARDMNRGSVAANDLDSAQTTLDTAKAALTSAQGAAEAARAQLSGARSAMQSAEAAIRSAEAQAQGGQVSLDQTHIVAPMSGSIANLSINTGSYVAPGMDLMALVPDQMWVTANFKETQLVNIKVGDPVDITIDAYPGRHFSGKVESIQRAAGQEFQLLPAQNATGNFVKVVQRVPVRIMFDKPLPKDLAIGPGMSVVPTITVR